MPSASVARTIGMWSMDWALRGTGMSIQTDSMPMLSPRSAIACGGIGVSIPTDGDGVAGMVLTGDGAAGTDPTGDGMVGMVAGIIITTTTTQTGIIRVAAIGTTAIGRGIPIPTAVR